MLLLSWWIFCFHYSLNIFLCFSSISLSFKFMTCSPHTNVWPNWTNLNIWGQSQITKWHQLPCTASRLESRFATNYFLTLLTNCQPIWLFWISEVSLKWQSDLQWPQVPRTALRLELKYYTTNYFLVLHTKFQPNRTTLNIQEIRPIWGLV